MSELTCTYGRKDLNFKSDKGEKVIYCPDCDFGLYEIAESWQEQAINFTCKSGKLEIEFGKSAQSIIELMKENEKLKADNKTLMTEYCAEEAWLTEHNKVKILQTQIDAFTTDKIKAVIHCNAYFENLETVTKIANALINLLHGVK